MNDSRRKEIKEIVLNFLRQCERKGIHISLPVPLKAMVKTLPNCRLVRYSEQCARRGLTKKELILHAGTDDSFCDYWRTKNLYIIYYNDMDSSKVNSKRYRWNIAHELGHILLNHHRDHTETRLFRNELSLAAYKELEDEADMFAAYLLVPHGALYVYESQNVKITSSWIQQFCKISGPASSRRLKLYKQWIRNGAVKNGEWSDSYDLQIARIFIKTRTCKSCGHVFLRHSSSERYCSICGKTNFIFGKGKNEMVYKGFELNKNGKAIVCPRCGNEETSIDGSYCQICGLILINSCAPTEADRDENNYLIINQPCSLGKALPGNARFCPYCGNESTFYQSGILKAWDAKDNKQDHKNSDLPFKVDSDLPF